jgi:hypothetical protein
MLACTLLTTVAYAKNDTLNTIANDNPTFFYPQVKVLNKTQFTATVKITYPGCKNDENIVIAPKGTGLGKSGLSRAGCLVIKIEATFATNGGASVIQITNYSSSGTGASDFIIEESALNERETQFECMVYRMDKEGMPIGVKPGFVVWNKTKVPVEVSLIVGPRWYHSMVLPGKKFESTTGSFWFRINAEVCLDGKPKDDNTWAKIFTPFAALVHLIAVIEKKTYANISFEGDNPWEGLGMKEILLDPILKVGNDTTSAIEVNKKNLRSCETEILNSGSAVTFLDSQYSGANEVFSKQSEKPTYEITEGIYYDKAQNLIVTRKLCLTKINTVGNNMMAGTKKSSCN